MDIALVLYAADLERYITALHRDHIPHLVLEWTDDKHHTWYSLLVQVSTSQLVMELVSDKRPLSSSSIIKEDLHRLPASVFVKNNVSAHTSHVLVPLGISKAVSNMDAVSRFFKEELFAEEVYTTSSKAVVAKMFALAHSTLIVRVVQRPASSTAGAFKVSDLEEAKLHAHKFGLTDEFCGVDKWYDNHFAYDAFWNTTLDEFKAAFDKHRRMYHIFGDCKPSKIKGPGTNIYVVDPTGDAVQLDGKWTHCPQGGDGDALQDPCSQGSCRKYQPTHPCTSRLDSLCAAVKYHNSTCTDCCYRQWQGLTDAGCRNADIVNFCITSHKPALAMVV
jgi:hypothetical protein